MALAHSPRIIINNLFLCLDAANTKSYPGSGTTWTDLSTNKTNGTLINSPGFSNTNGGTITFDGTNDSCNTSLSGPTTFTTDSEFTMSCWAKFSAYKADASSIGTLFGAFNYQGYGLFWAGTPTSYVIGSYMRSTSTVSDIRSSAITPGNWFYAVQTYSKTSNLHRLYINGVLSNNTTSISGAFSAGLNGISIAIANGVPGINDGTPGGGTPGTPLLGNVAQASIYNRALSATEVNQNFNALRGRFGL